VLNRNPDQIQSPKKMSREDAKIAKDLSTLRGLRFFA
jgi:hypothetical protein